MKIARRGPLLTSHCLLIVMSFLVGGCATTRSLQSLSLGATKAEIQHRMGSPSAVRGAIVNKYGQHVEVWEYQLSTTSQSAQKLGLGALTMGMSLLMPDRNQVLGSYYWLYFVDDRLAQWGQAGDWAREADRIYEIQFR